MTESSMSEDHVHSRAMSRAAMPDAHGQAALLLAESTLHSLLDAGVLTLDQVISTVTTAVEVKVEVADEVGESDARMKQSLGLLEAIKVSFGRSSTRPGLHIV